MKIKKENNVKDLRMRIIIGLVAITILGSTISGSFNIVNAAPVTKKMTVSFNEVASNGVQTKTVTIPNLKSVVNIRKVAPTNSTVSHTIAGEKVTVSVSGGTRTRTGTDTRTGTGSYTSYSNSSTHDLPSSVQYDYGGYSGMIPLKDSSRTFLGVNPTYEKDYFDTFTQTVTIYGDSGGTRTYPSGFENGVVPGFLAYKSSSSFPGLKVISEQRVSTDYGTYTVGGQNYDIKTVVKFTYQYHDGYRGTMKFAGSLSGKKTLYDGTARYTKSGHGTKYLYLYDRESKSDSQFPATHSSDSSFVRSSVSWDSRIVYKSRDFSKTEVKVMKTKSISNFMTNYAISETHDGYVYSGNIGRSPSYRHTGSYSGTVSKSINYWAYSVEIEYIDNQEPTVEVQSPITGDNFSDNEDYNNIHLKVLVNDADVGDKIKTYYRIGGSKGQPGIQFGDEKESSGSKQLVEETLGKSKVLGITRGAKDLFIWAEDDKGGVSVETLVKINIDKTKPILKIFN